MGKCIKCGDCCEFYALGASLEQITADAKFPDRDFVLKHLTPRQAPKHKPNPLMSDRAFDGFYWYSCDLFDSVKRLCKDYENRPGLCGKYPKNHKPKDLISARCGFFKE